MKNKVMIDGLLAVQIQKILEWYESEVRSDYGDDDRYAKLVTQIKKDYDTAMKERN